jgi:hypothetical protein
MPKGGQGQGQAQLNANANANANANIQQGINVPQQNAQMGNQQNPVNAANAVAVNVNAGPQQMNVVQPVNVVQQPNAVQPVNAQPANANKKKTNIKEITGKSQFAQRWVDLYANNSDEQDFKDAAEEVSKGLVAEFHNSKKVSDKSVGRRQKAFAEKNKLRTTAEQAYTQYKVDQAAIENDVDDAFENNLEEFSQKVWDMMDDTTNYMEYKDDENFVKHYGESIERLTKNRALYDALNKITRKDYTEMNEELEKAKKKKLPSLEDARKKALDNVYIHDFYQAKIDVIRNPFYTILKESDTQKFTLEEKKKLADDYQAQGNEKLAAYFKALYRMDEAAALGAQHIEDTRSAIYRFGNSGRTGNKWRIDFFSVRHKFSHVNFNDITDFNIRNQRLKKDRKKETDTEDPEVKERGKYNYGINVGVANYNVKLKGAKASVKKKGKWWYTGANASLLAGNASSSLNAKGGVRRENGEWRLASNQGLFGDVKVGGAVVQGRVKAGLDFDYFKAQVHAKGKALTASATGSAKAGYIKWTDKDGKVHKELAAGVMLSAQAAVVEGEVGTTFTVFGAKFSISLTGQAGGFGGTIGGEVTESSVKATFGALFGLGFKLNFKLDFSGFAKYWTDKYKKYKLNGKKKDEYEKNNRGRAVPDRKKANANP